MVVPPTPAPDLEPWIGYIRVSTWKEEKISPELQRTAIEDWARRTGRRVVDWIIDLDATGRNFKRKIMRGIERVEAREAVGIAVWKFSRFGRNDVGIAVNLARLEEAGGHLQSATEDVDARTAVGRFNRRILFDLAVFESDRAGEQWKETHAHRREAGLPATGRPRFGYIWHQRWNPRTETLQAERYEIDGEVAPYVEKLYERKIAGEGFALLAGWLNGHGYTARRGGQWTANSVQRFMDTGFAAGMLRLHSPDCKHATPSALAKCGNYLFVEGAHEGIISPETWERYLAHRESTKATPPRARVATYTLTALLRCGECRYCLAHHSGGSVGATVAGYGVRCNHALQTNGTGCRGVRMTRVRAERAVLDWLTEHGVAADVDAAPPVPQQRPDVATERAHAARERARLQAEVDKLAAGLARLQADRAINPDDYGPGAYEAARDRIKAQQQAAQTALERVATVEATPHRADYEPLVLDLLDAWELLTAPERNAILRQVIRRVVAYRVERDGKRPTARIEVHPVWEPDPWHEEPPAE